MARSVGALPSDVESDETHSNDTIFMNFMSFCRVCLSEDHETSRCGEVKKFRDVWSDANQHFHTLSEPASEE